MKHRQPSLNRNLDKFLTVVTKFKVLAVELASLASLIYFLLHHWKG